MARRDQPRQRGRHRSGTAKAWRDTITTAGEIAAARYRRGQTRSLAARTWLGSGPGLGLWLRLWLRLRRRGWSGSRVRAAVYQCRLEAPAAHDRPCTPAVKRHACARACSHPLRPFGLSAPSALAARRRPAGSTAAQRRRSTRAPGGRFTRPVLGGRGPRARHWA